MSTKLTDDQIKELTARCRHSETGFPHCRAVPRPYMIDITTLARIPRNKYGEPGVIVVKRR